MSNNPFYTYSGAFLPGLQARAETVQAEFQAVQAGFSEIDIEGTDSGVANAYVVTTTGGYPSVSYTDGLSISFKPLYTNTGASTINVNTLGVVALLRATGAAVQSGDIVAGAWYTLTYTSGFSGWCISMPATVTGFSGTVSSAAPTHLVGLTAAAGASSSAAPIDVTFAIDQTIAPTWTGAHTFNHGISVAGALSGGMAAYVSAPAGSNYGAFIAGGTGASSYVLKLTDLSQGVILLSMYADGHGAMGGTGGTSLTFSTAGTATFNNGVTVAGLGAGTPSIVINSSGTTGTATASLSATNKPGSTTRTTPAVWLPVQLDGTAYYVPCYAGG